jgi:hypothetical protein
MTLEQRVPSHSCVSPYERRDAISNWIMPWGRSHQHGPYGGM